MTPPLYQYLVPKTFKLVRTDQVLLRNEDAAPMIDIYGTVQGLQENLLGSILEPSRCSL